MAKSLRKQRQAVETILGRMASDGHLVMDGPHYRDKGNPVAAESAEERRDEKFEEAVRDFCRDYNSSQDRGNCFVPEGILFGRKIVKCPLYGHACAGLNGFGAYRSGPTIKAGAASNQEARRVLNERCYL